MGSGSSVPVAKPTPCAQVAPLACAPPNVDAAPVARMHFQTLEDMTKDDFEVLRAVHDQHLTELPDFLIGMLTSLGEDKAYPICRRAHSIQAATRAMRDGRDEEYIVVCLLHDLGEALGPLNHGEVIAAILRPFINEANHFMLLHHPLFQTYFYGSNVGVDPNGRDAHRKSPHFEHTAEFCKLYDEVSFDPNYPNEPLETFVPMVRRVLSKKWVPPNSSNTR
eukprot:CAMPEP_0203884476 /NCGR_PEP_ID=MMETSP0359-20131031/28530_1 /ASSEMBLY_ACC=CAM_ASM_000338 /TAXON_ID=268821 /ORGANISM="Scrippsiella Hangoei, Strain SHTV-5" /LENGTH=221 /DNA_ID=CAMNT_0050804947 /DNA_START=40 /DNA_END=702 /DNA_ORIENTATION=-